VPGVDGACIFFTEDFLAEAFRDPRFVANLACFRSDRPAASLALTFAEQRRYRNRFRAMQAEIAALQPDSAHALRAVLYEVLVWLDRIYVARYGAPPPAGPRSLVHRFQDHVERDFRTHRQVADYARTLGVSPGHLSACCRAGGRPGPGARIRARLALEARRLLLYTGDTAAEIAEGLGFTDPAYFARFFRRETGLSPSAFRRRG
jgi:AraC family transcriptional activator of pobA